MQEEYMLSTSDNPWNPWTQFDEWLAFDMMNGYNTLNYLDRVTFTSTELSEADYNAFYDDGINKILSINLTGNYVKVKRPKHYNPKAKYLLANSV